ncbi:hypothetical protein HY844_00190 [Candidatus Berkelbacteria bacterium]|nr:hypothetical protein [Candidatus Berkelbacteria bacterium]
MRSNAYITLISILIIGAVSLAITLSVLTFGIVSGQNTATSNSMFIAKGLADSCAEEALIQINLSPQYVGTETLTTGPNSCTYTVTDTGETAKLITSISTVGTIKRKVTVQVSAIIPNIIISSWVEN